ncbi:hypothetical protein JCM5353_005853 [Sporobolomyces roseus]
MALVHQDSTKIDRFSSLPNELIQHILDHAYPYGLYAGEIYAPSKRFHPFYQFHLYRSIDIHTKQAIEGLIRSLQANPTLGLVTTSLKFSESYKPKKNQIKSIADSRQLSTLLPLLPNLQEWTPRICLSSDIIDTVTPAMLPSLTRISLPVTESKDSYISVDLLSWISTLPALGTLEASNWDSKKLEAIDHTFPTIRTLFLKGKKVTTRSATKLVNACPNLSELRLYNASTNSVTNYERVLLRVEPRILRLDLMSATYFPLTQAAFANYSHLRYLRLLVVSFPEDLHLCLASMEKLEELVLQSTWAMVPTQELLKLVDGPRKLPKLRKISLDIAVGCIGQRVNPFSSKGMKAIKSKEYEEWLVDIDEGDWFIDSVLDHGSKEWLDCKRFLVIAKENGIMVDGEFLDGLDTLHAFILELNNLSIVRAYYHSNLRTIFRARQFALDHRFSLPELDIDSIDPKKLELVKVEMEEHGWFALTLRNKE